MKRTECKPSALQTHMSVDSIRDGVELIRLFLIAVEYTTTISHSDYSLSHSLKHNLRVANKLQHFPKS